MVAVSDLAGSGGAERLFSDLHERLDSSCACETTLITSRAALARLRAAGRLSGGRRIVALRLGSRPARGKIATAWATLRLLVAARRFDVVHICLPTPTYAPYAALVTRLPRALRPAVALTVIDCTLASSLDTPPADGTYERQVLDAHRLYFRWARLDGIYSWYRSAAEAIAGHGLAPTALVRSARYCFADTDRFTPGPKENLVVFAGRLSEQKRPLLFVDAVERLVRTRPDLASGLAVEMYGTGVLEPAVRTRIAGHGLADFIRLGHAPDMAPVFARSKLFVSTQAIENFTSLAMLEAMAAGNAVVAADVGQTREFVRDGENGVLVQEETPEAFADAIAAYLADSGRHACMAAASRRIATEVHTAAHFAGDIISFWSEVVGDRPAA